MTRIDRSLGLGLLLAALVLAAFSPSVIGPPFWDDVQLIAASDKLSGPLDAFRPQSFGLRDLPQGQGAHFWRPLVTASLWWQGRVAALIGVGPNHLRHLVQCLWHAAAAWLVWRLLCRLAPADPRPSWWNAAAWWAALVWAVVPLKVENVTWISGRGDVMGWMLLLIGAEIANRSGRWASRAVVAFIATGLALLCKEAWIIAPLVWWLASRDRTAPSPARLLAQPEIVGSVAVAFVYAVVRLTLVGAARGGGDPMFASLGFFDRLTVPFETVGHAAFALATPWAPRLLRGPWGFAQGQLVPDGWAGGAGLVIALCAAVLWLKAPRARDAIMLVVAPLLPVLNVVPTGLEARMSDRYLYVPVLGVILGFLLAIPASGIRWPAWPLPRPTWLAVPVAALLLFVPQPRIRQFTRPALLWAAEAAHPDAATTILVQQAHEEEIAGRWRPARDASLRVARRYGELGFAEGLPYALNAARLEAFASGLREPQWTYVAALRCIRLGSAPDVAVPFADGGGVRIPCQGPEAEALRATRGAMLDAEIERVERRLRGPTN
jgi:hypothetical protein